VERGKINYLINQTILMEFNLLSRIKYIKEMRLCGGS
jgi:hypothetical protein